MQDNNKMTIQDNTQKEKDENNEFLNNYIGKKVHLYLKNKFYYLCEVNRISEVGGNIFVEIFDLKKKVYQLISFETISKMEVICDGK